MSDFPRFKSRSEGFLSDQKGTRSVESRARKITQLQNPEYNLPPEKFGPDHDRAELVEPRDHKQVLKISRKRLPPGQVLTTQRPVLDLGLQPAIPKDQWHLDIGGLCARTIRLNWQDLMGLPQAQQSLDIHCVTGWSRFDNIFSGVKTTIICALAQPEDNASYVLIRSHDGYSTGMPLKDFLNDEAILATHWDDTPITRPHGGPLRLIIPQLYFWKSAKWVRQIWFTDRPIKGYWESRGYHDGANPWKEERSG